MPIASRNMSNINHKHTIKHSTDIFYRYLNLQNDQYARYLDIHGNEARIFVVIPCFNEPDILTTLISLAECSPPKGIVSVLVVVNDAENSIPEAVSQNNWTLDSIKNWQCQHPELFFNIQRIHAQALPKKWAGVGWARKIGMDEAIRQLARGGKPDGIIVSLDADSTVSKGYLQTIENAFEENPISPFFLINFEHSLDYKGISSIEKDGIIRYELHMRYFKNAMARSGYPHAIHTVGSSFALKASAYVKQGGMNRRKAGEDFYFLHKLVLLGNYGNIYNATVFPAPRVSDRVPFGTGAALKKWMEGSSELLTTYSLSAFSHLKPLFSNPSKFWSLNKTEIENLFTQLDFNIQSFLRNSQSIDQLLELISNCSNEEIFRKRFFHLFNAFWILKYLNFVHESALMRADLRTESIRLLHSLGILHAPDISLESLLKIYREIDKQTH